MQQKDLPKATHINLIDFRTRTLELTGWFTGFVILVFVIPGILIFSLPPNQRPEGIAVLAAVPFLEYLAISIGIGLGINPIISFFLTTLPCIGLGMLVFGILGFVSDSSKRVTRFLHKIKKKIDKYPRLSKYGVASNFLFVMFLGVYIAPGVSIVLGWARVRSIIFMAGGIAFITILIGLGTLGIIDLFFL